MNIFYDHQIFTIQKYGGISNYYYNLVKLLNQRKFVNLQIYAPLYINEYIKNLPPNIVWGKRLNLNKFKLNLIVNNYFTNFKLNSFQPDIVHLTYYNSHYNKNKRSKYVLTVYDMIHEQYPYYFNNKRLSDNKRQACEVADHIICISENTKKNIVNIFNVPEKKISVIYLGADHLSLVDDINIEFNDKFILFVGSRKNYKNFSILLKAFYSNKEIYNNYKIIAFGGERVSRETKEEIKSLKIDNNKIIFFKGSDQILKNLNKKASLFVCPSLEEGFGIPPLEAISVGCPVLVSDIAVFREILKDKCELFNPSSVSDLSLKMEKMLNLNEFEKKLSDKVNSSEVKYKWINCAEQTYNLYESLL